MVPQPKPLFDQPSVTPSRVPSSGPKPLFAPAPVAPLKPKAAPLFVASTPATPKSSAPRVLFSNSTVRRRIEVSLDELAYPNATPAALKEAHYLVVSLDVDEVNPSFVLDWGATIQEEHQALLSILLGSAIERESSVSKSLIVQVIQLIESVDLGALDKGSLFSSRESKRAKVGETLKQVASISDQLVAQLPSLKAAWKALDGMEAKLRAVESRIQPYVISCDFFAHYQAKSPDFPSPLFISRLISLTNTQLTIAQNHQQRQLLEDAALALVDTIQGTIRGEIPTWQNAYLNVLTSGGSASTLSTSQSSILSKLKSTVS